MMPQERDCDYCGKSIEPGTGTMFVSTDGTVTHYCSSKCESNADLGREARDLEWTESGGAGAAEADAEATEDEATEDEATEDEATEDEATEDEATDEAEADTDEAEADTDEAEADAGGAEADDDDAEPEEAEQA
jgi:large subunit ribosomal protein L24e